MERQPAVKEESLSDWLLYDISRRLKHVHYHAFNRHQEARETGADWEWWILYPGQYLRLRVQAKKAFEDKDNYPEVLRSNKYGLQIDKLISDADSVNAIPLYAFFSSSRHSSMCRGGSGHPDGVFLSGAKLIYDRYINQPRQKVAASDLIAQSNPFSCFGCCPLSYDTPEGATRFLETYYEAEAVSDDADRNPRGIHGQLPSYVTSLLEYEPEDIPDWWDREFAQTTNDFKALLIYDFRNRNA